MLIEPNVKSYVQLQMEGALGIPSSSDRCLIGFYSRSGRQIKLINDYSSFIKEFVPGGFKRSDHHSVFAAARVAKNIPILAVRLNAGKSDGIVFHKPSSEIVSKTVLNENGKIDLNKYETKSNDLSSVTFTPTSSYLRINNDAYCSATFTGTLTGTPNIIEVDYSGTSFIEFITKISEIQSSSDYNVILDSSKYLKITSLNTVIVTAVPSITMGTPTSLDNLGRVYIGCNYSSDSNIVKVSITDIDNDLFTLNVTNLLTNETESYRLSSDIDAINSYGESIHFESINELRDDIFLIDLYPSGISTNVVYEISDVSIGNSFTPNYTMYQTMTPDVHLNELTEKLEDYVNSNRISLIFDAGMAIPAYQSLLLTLAGSIDYKSECYLSTPRGITYNQELIYRDSINFDDWHGYIGVGWDTDKSMANFPIDLSTSTYVLERIGINASLGYKYAPVFGTSTGIVAMSSKVYNLNKRDGLQAKQMNPAKYSDRSKITYMANNLTMSKTDSDLNEEHICRLVNDVRYDIDLRLDDYLSWDWELDTCDAIIESIDNYFINKFRDNLRVPMEENPLISCTLNGRNKLKVEVQIRPVGSVKYITVYYKVISLNS